MLDEVRCQGHLTQTFLVPGWVPGVQKDFSASHWLSSFLTLSRGVGFPPRRAKDPRAHSETATGGYPKRPQASLAFFFILPLLPPSFPSYLPCFHSIPHPNLLNSKELFKFAY